ncbi:GntR family transcriptional regulator [Roseococcus pinisoli]|uniref:GntR family transcriptional regulator n=1 Tax=Roseococcus pinisoli TaxID=2835040 RepID=A0ABS5QER5_9PROT|nr:GntR family transcriptional regulator [uncultured Roseococcus sp.]MBS7811402.1 GntR family transcriptional regulator [Roseococcus pinisoli]
MRKFFNPYPKYLHIRRILLDRIESSMRLGDQLPTEHALSAEFSVSRETIRTALAALEQDGIIERTPGRGTFVSGLPRRRPERRLTGMVEDFLALNLDTETKTLQAGPGRIPPALAEELGIDPEMPLFRLTRLRYFERRPFAWHDGWMLPAIGERLRAIDLRRTTVERELRDTLKLTTWEDQQSIEAVAADIPSAELLDVPIGAPLLCMTRLYLLEDESFGLYFRTLYRSDRYYYTVKLAHPPAVGPRPMARGFPIRRPPAARKSPEA